MNYFNARVVSQATLRVQVYCGGTCTVPFAFLGGHFPILIMGLSPCRGDPHRAGSRVCGFLGRWRRSAKNQAHTDFGGGAVCNGPNLVCGDIAPGTEHSRVPRANGRGGGGPCRDYATWPVSFLSEPSVILTHLALRWTATSVPCLIKRRTVASDTPRIFLVSLRETSRSNLLTCSSLP